MSIVPPARSMRVGAEEASTVELYEVDRRAGVTSGRTAHRRWRRPAGARAGRIFRLRTAKVSAATSSWIAHRFPQDSAFDRRATVLYYRPTRWSGVESLRSVNHVQESRVVVSRRNSKRAGRGTGAKQRD